MPRGGARPGAGAPRRRFTLRPESARILREIVRQWNAEQPAGRYTAPKVVSDLIYGEAIKRGAFGTEEQRAHWVAIAKGEQEPSA